MMRDQQALTQLAREAIATSKRSTPVPTLRPGTVQDYGDPELLPVLLDGDTFVITAQPLTPSPAAGDRVMVELVPPSGAFVVGFLGESRDSWGTGGGGEQGPPGPQGPQGPTGPAGPAGPGVPPGGATGTVLTKTSGADYATAWQAAAAAYVGGAGLVLTGQTFDVGQGTGIVVAADSVGLDLTYTDGRYVNTTGDTVTGALTVNGGLTAQSGLTANALAVFNAEAACGLAPSSGTRLANKDYVDGTVAAAAPTAGAGLTRTGQTLDVGQGYGLTVAADTIGIDQSIVVTRQVLDNTTTGLVWKQPVRGATTANIALNGTGQTIDGQVVGMGERWLVRAQTNAAENGIWQPVTGGAWTRALDADLGTELVGATVYVIGGTTLGRTTWQMTSAPPMTPGTTAQTWTQFGAGGGGGTAEVNVSTGGPSPRVGELLWVDTDDVPAPVVGQRWSPEYTINSGTMAGQFSQGNPAAITHGLGVKPSLIVGHLEDGGWAHQCQWRMSVLDTTSVGVTFLNLGPNAATAVLRFRLLY